MSKVRLVDNCSPAPRNFETNEIIDLWKSKINYDRADKMAIKFLKEKSRKIEALFPKELVMKIAARPKDWERIAYYLHRLAAREPLRKKHECRAARRLGNLIADIVSEQRNKWMDDRRKWDKEKLEEFIFKQGKTPEEIAEIMGTNPEKVEKVLRRMNLLQE